MRHSQTTPHKPVSRRRTRPKSPRSIPQRVHRPGEDIFSLAGNDRIFEQGMKVRQEGPHLVEIDSDAVAHIFIRVDLQTPLD